MESEEAKFHINKAGKAAECKASIRSCPLGGEHYSSLSEATDRAYIKSDEANEANRVYLYSKIFNEGNNRPGDGEKMAQAYKYAFCESYSNWSNYSLDTVYKNFRMTVEKHLDQLNTDELKTIASITKPMGNTCFEVVMKELKDRDKFVKFLGEASIRGDKDVKETMKARDGGGFGDGPMMSDSQRTNLRTIAILAAS